MGPCFTFCKAQMVVVTNEPKSSLKYDWPTSMFNQHIPVCFADMGKWIFLLSLKFFYHVFIVWEGIWFYPGLLTGLAFLIKWPVLTVWSIIGNVFWAKELQREAPIVWFIH